MFLLLGATTMANEEAIPSSPLGPEPEVSFDNTVLIPCSICGRTFKSESLLKHQTVCQKNATKKRRVFDSLKQRIQGTELAEYIPVPVVPPKPKLIPISKAAVKKSSKDDQRAGEPHVNHHANTPVGTEKTPVRPAITRSNSISVHGAQRSGGAAVREERCPHCDRTFGWKAFSRHEEWCREHKSRLAQAQSPAAVLKAKEMLEARIKYRAPTLSKSKRTNREKYSGGAHCSPVVHKLSVDDSPILNSMKATVSSSNKVVSESRVRVASKTSTAHVATMTASSAHQSDTPSSGGAGSTPRRALSPSKKISRVIHNPWNKLSSGIGVDSNPVEDYDKVFASIPSLECSQDKGSEELLQWIKQVKACLKKQNNVHSKDSEERAIDSPDSQWEAEKRCHWEMESTAVDKCMRRTFVYEALSSSNESTDGQMGACPIDIISQIEKVNVLYCKESQKQIKDGDSKETRAETPARSAGTVFRLETDDVLPSSSEPQAIVENKKIELPNHLVSQVKEESNGHLHQKILTSSMSCGISSDATLGPRCKNINLCMTIPSDVDHLEDVRKGEQVKKRRSKLPVPISKYCGQPNNEILRTTLDDYKEMMDKGHSSDFTANMSNFPSKKLNNTFILSKKALEECGGFGGQSNSNKTTDNEIEMDSLECSSDNASPLLQKGIIRECGPELFESNIPANEFIVLGRNAITSKKSPRSGSSSVGEACSVPVHLRLKNKGSSQETSNGAGYCHDFHDKCSGEEACGVPVHLLVKNIDSSQENSNGTGFGDDLIAKGNSQEALFENETSRSPMFWEDEVKSSQVWFNDADASHCQSTDNSTCYQSRRESGGSLHCYLNVLDNKHDSPLKMKDLATDPSPVIESYAQSKTPLGFSNENNNKLDESISCPGIKVHYSENAEGERLHCSAKNLGNSKERVSPVSSLVEDINLEDIWEHPQASHIGNPQISEGEKGVLSGEVFINSQRNNRAHSHASRIVSSGDLSPKKRFKDNFPKMLVENKKNVMHGTHRQGELKGNCSDQMLEMSMDKGYPTSLKGEILNDKSLGSKDEINSCHFEKMIMGTRLQDDVKEELKGNDLVVAEYVNLPESIIRKYGMFHRQDASSISMRRTLPERNVRNKGIRENLSLPDNVLSCERGQDQEHAGGSSVSSTYSNSAYLCGYPSTSSDCEPKEVDSLTSVLSKYTNSSHDPPKGSLQKSNGLSCDCSAMSTAESLAALNKPCRKKLKNRKHKGKANVETLMEKGEAESSLKEQRSPSAFSVGSHDNRFIIESNTNDDEMSTGYLPKIRVGNDFAGTISSGNSVQRVTNSQHKWLNLIRNMSESEIGCVESVEKVMEMMPDSNESVSLQRKGIAKKSCTFGLTSSDLMEAENRVKARLFGANRKDRPILFQKFNSSPLARSPACGRKTVPPLSMRADLPEMASNGQTRRPIPSSPVFPQPDPKPLLSFPFKSSAEKKVSETGPVATPPSRQSMYDPFSRAEMQLKELLSDEGAEKKQLVGAQTPVATNPPDGLPTIQNGVGEKLESVSPKTNGSSIIQDVYCNQKQAKEVELPDLFTETSMQLEFEMPNVMRSRRDRSVNTKRRALKPTAQNMGIELSAIGRDQSTGGQAATTQLHLSKAQSNKFEDEEVEQITSIMNMGFCIPRLRGDARSNPGDELDIDSIHQSINLVALGLTNLSADSRESLADKDNNNEWKGEGGTKEEVDFSGNVLKETLARRRVPESSGDSDSEGGQRVARRVRVVRLRGAGTVAGKGSGPVKTSTEGDAPGRGSSHESLTGTQQPMSGKPSVDSAYNSLNRPTFRTIEQAKEATTKAFDLPHRSSSSDGENDHADEWSDDEEGAKKNGQNRLNAEIKSNAAVKYAKFCHNCGSKYSISEAKFCCVCGAQRLTV